MKVEKSLRYRVNVSQTSTGKKSWDCTVEYGENDKIPLTFDGAIKGMKETLELSDALVKELEMRYPAEIKEK